MLIHILVIFFIHTHIEIQILLKDKLSIIFKDYNFLALSLKYYEQMFSELILEVSYN